MGDRVDWPRPGQRRRVFRPVNRAVSWRARALSVAARGAILRGMKMPNSAVRIVIVIGFGVGLGVPSVARAIDLGGLTDKAKGAAESGAKGKIEKEVNAKLLAEGKKNQCSFKSDSDQLMPGCDAKVKKLTARGIAPNEITSIGMGSDKPLVTPDDTPAKKAKNRRYEIQVRL